MAQLYLNTTHRITPQPTQNIKQAMNDYFYRNNVPYEWYQFLCFSIFLTLHFLTSLLFFRIFRIGFLRVSMVNFHKFVEMVHRQTQVQKRSVCARISQVGLRGRI